MSVAPEIERLEADPAVVERIRELAVRVEGMYRPFPGIRPGPAYELACLVLGVEPQARPFPPTNQPPAF